MLYIEMEKISKEEVKKMITELESNYINRELLAGKLGVTAYAIRSWMKDNRNPSYATRKLLKQIYNGYKSRR